MPGRIYDPLGLRCYLQILHTLQGRRLAHRVVCELFIESVFFLLLELRQRNFNEISQFIYLFPFCSAIAKKIIVILLCEIILCSF